MTKTLSVRDRLPEAIDVREGLHDEEMRATVRIMGILRQLESDRARQRVVGFIADYFAEQADLA